MVQDSEFVRPCRKVASVAFYYLNRLEKIDDDILDSFHGSTSVYNHLQLKDLIFLEKHDHKDHNNVSVLLSLFICLYVCLSFFFLCFVFSLCLASNVLFYVLICWGAVEESAESWGPRKDGKINNVSSAEVSCGGRRLSPRGS